MSGVSSGDASVAQVSKGLSGRKMIAKRSILRILEWIPYLIS